jgi:hypothetical protein
MNGWIKLHRKILDWEWYRDANTMRVFLHCILLANHEDLKWKGQVIKKGSFVSSYTKLAEELNLSPKQIRTALDKLKNSENVAGKWAGQYSIITVKNYSLWQTNGQAEGRLRAGSCINKKERKEEDSSSSITTNNVYCLSSSTHFDIYGSYSNVYLSKKQYGTLLTQTGSAELLAILIDELSENIASKSDKDKVFDDRHPDMHFIRLEKYLKAHRNNRKEQVNEPKPYRPYG